MKGVAWTRSRRCSRDAASDGSRRTDVSREDEERLIEAAFAAPSSSNARPWHFVVVRDAATRARLAGVHQWSALIARAPLCIAVLGRADSTAWVEDGAAATENILTAATALGLGTCWVGIYENGPEPHPDEVACLEILGTTPDRVALPLPDRRRSSRRAQGAPQPVPADQGVVRARRAGGAR